MNTEDPLRIDAPGECARIAASIRAYLKRYGKKGLVVGISGGIDSAVTAALGVRALGSERVVGLLLPERESSPTSEVLGRQVCESLGIECIKEDITQILAACGCYLKYARALSHAIPRYEAAWKSKIVIQNSGGLSFFKVIAEDLVGNRVEARLTAQAYREAVAAYNYKQRTRKMVEYHYADSLGYVVAGTPNLLEYHQGFFVKAGDGQADIKPIAHLYKSQVYQLARALMVPAEIVNRAPTTDTYSLDQGQDEFYFELPYRKLDICLYSLRTGLPAARIASLVELEPDAIEKVWRAIERKCEATRYNHLPAETIDPIKL
jgi:NAD+ synthase